MRDDIVQFGIVRIALPFDAVIEQLARFGTGVVGKDVGSARKVVRLRGTHRDSAETLLQRTLNADAVLVPLLQSVSGVSRAACSARFFMSSAKEMSSLASR